MGVPPRSERGSQVATGRQHPRSDQVDPGGQNPRRDHSERGQTEGGRTEAGRGRTPPTTGTIRAQEADDGNEKAIGGLRTAEPPLLHQSKVADNGSAGTLPRHTTGTGGARHEHGALVRREYGLLALEGMAVDPADTGDTGSEASHGATADQD